LFLIIGSQSFMDYWMERLNFAFLVDGLSMMMTMNPLNLKKVYPAQDVPALSARQEEQACGKGSGKLPLHRSETPSISGKK